MCKSNFEVVHASCVSEVCPELDLKNQYVTNATHMNSTRVNTAYQS